MATKREAEVRVGTQVAASLRLACDLDRRARLGHTACDIARTEAQHIEAGLQTRRVERRQGAVDGAAPFGKQHPFICTFAGDLQAPGVEVCIGNAPCDCRHGVDAPPAQRRIEGHLGCRGIIRITHAQNALDGGRQTIAITYHRRQQVGATVRRGNQRPVLPIQRQLDAIEEEPAREDARVGFGKHGDRNHLPGHHRETGSQVDRRARRLGGQRRAQRQRAHRAGLAIRERHHHQVVTRLPRTGCPGKLTGHGIERGALGQPQRREAQRLAGIGIACREGEGEWPAKHDLAVVELTDHRRTVDVRNAYHDGEFIARTVQIAGTEAEHVLAGLVLIRCPLETSHGFVEEHAVGSRTGLRSPVTRVAEQRIHHGITVRVACQQRELQYAQLLATEWGNAGNERAAIAVRHLDRDVLGHRAVAIADRDHDAAVAAGLEVVRRIGEQAGCCIEPRTRGQVGCAVAQRIAVGVDRLDLQGEDFAFGHRLVADRQQQRHGVGSTHHDADRARVAADGTLAIIAVVGHREAERVHSGIGRRRRPLEHRGAILHSPRQRGPGGQGIGAEHERILVEVGGTDRESQHLAEHGNLVTDRRQYRCLGCRLGSDHEGVARTLAHALTATVAIVSGGERDDVITTILRPGGDAQHAGVVGTRDDRGKTRQTFAGEHERIAIRVADIECHLERLAAYHALVAEGHDERCPVRVVHGQRHLDRHRIRHAGSIAIIGCREAHRVAARLRVTRRPVEHPGLAVEACARR